LLISGRRSFVAFYLEEHDPDWDGTYVRVVDPGEETEESLALAEFKESVAVKLGPPNDEVLHGHPLDGRGLAGYGCYVVENSRWLAELIEINRVHEQFDPEWWEDKRHFLLVFHDETVEAVAREIEVHPLPDVDAGAAHAVDREALVRVADASRARGRSGRAER
jgi:hypothetical protein